MDKQREEFEAWAKKETNWDLYWSNNINQYMDHQTNGAWLAWQQAQKVAVSEGFVLVSREPSLKVLDRLFAEHDLDEDRASYIYRDVINAQEQVG